jgi:hypothetical protein
MTLIKIKQTSLNFLKLKRQLDLIRNFINWPLMPSAQLIILGLTHG